MSSITPEAALQVMINKWVRAYVPQPHFFTGIDRAKQSGRFTHARQKARGLVSGTPDTLLIVPSLPPITIELKARGRKVDEDSNQERVGAAIRAAGGFWGWCDTVTGYAALLVEAGVQLAGRWDIAAAGHDATLASAAIHREEKKTGKPSSKRFQKEKPSAARIGKMEALRHKVMF